MPIEVEEQKALFPELDTDNAEQRKLLNATKRLHALKGERTQLLTTSKFKVDEQEKKVIALMHECKIAKFKHGNVTVSLIPGGEKVDVKVKLDDAEDEEESDDE